MSHIIYNEETINELGDSVRALSGRTEELSMPEMIRAIKLAAIDGAGGTGTGGAYSKGLAFTTNSGDVTTCTLTGIGECIDTTIIIPAVDSGRVVTSIAASAFKNNKTIKELYVPNTVLTIGVSAFEGCTALSRVILPIKLDSLGQRAFYGCTSLTDLELPVYLKDIPNYAFYNNRIKSLRLPVDVTSVGWDAFYRSNSITTSFEIPKTLASSSGFNYRWTLTNMHFPDAGWLDYGANVESGYVAGPVHENDYYWYNGHLTSGITAHYFEHDTELYSGIENVIPVLSSGTYVIAGDFYIECDCFWDWETGECACGNDMFSSYDHFCDRYILTVTRSFNSERTYNMVLTDDITGEILWRHDNAQPGGVKISIGDICCSPTARVIKRGYHDN